MTAVITFILALINLLSSKPIISRVNSEKLIAQSLFCERVTCARPGRAGLAESRRGGRGRLAWSASIARGLRQFNDLPGSIYIIMSTFGGVSKLLEGISKKLIK